MKRLLLLAALFLATPAAAQTWDVRVKEMTPAGGVCVTGLLAGILQTAPCTLVINTGAGISGGPLISTGTITLAAVRTDGRLVASTGIPAGPIPFTTVTNATGIWYIPSQNGGDLITIYNGTAVSDYHFGVSGITLSLGANWTANAAFDVFAVLVGNVPALCTVPWTSLTARATALDTTVLPYATNSISVTCRTSNTTTVTTPANQGTYLGSFYTNGSAGQVDYNFGGYGIAGSPASLAVWNAYNQVPVIAMVQDSVATWTYTGSTYRNADASAGNSVTAMIGRQGTAVEAKYMVAAANSGVTPATVGISVNGGAPAGIFGTIYNASSSEATAVATVSNGLGQTIIQPQENSHGSNVTYTAAGPQGLTVRLLM